MNIAYLIIETILVYLSLTFLYRKKGTDGLYFWCSIAIILSNIMSLKTTEIIGMEVSLGFVIYTSIFIATNILVQHQGPEEVRKLFITTIVSSLLSLIIILFSTQITSPIIIDNNSYNYIYSGNIRPILGNITALLTIWFNALLYHQLRKIKNKIPVSNILSGLIITFMSTIIISIVTYIGKVNIEELSILIFIRYILSIIVHIIGTIPIIISCKLK